MYPSDIPPLPELPLNFRGTSESAVPAVPNVHREQSRVMQALNSRHIPTIRQALRDLAIALTEPDRREYLSSNFFTYELEQSSQRILQALQTGTPIDSVFSFNVAEKVILRIEDGKVTLTPSEDSHDAFKARFDVGDRPITTAPLALKAFSFIGWLT